MTYAELKLQSVSNWNVRLQGDAARQIDVIEFGEMPYLDCQSAMQDFAMNRSRADIDQIWILQHPKIYTQGVACKQQPVAASSIPLVKSDRGGQITYHGPGQIVMYPMLRLKRYGIGVKAMVNYLEQAVIDLLNDLNIVAQRRQSAPGVYVNNAKIAALGLRIRNGTSYHGLSLNVDMDLTPFTNIDPCGFHQLRVTQIVDEREIEISELGDLGKKLVDYFCHRLSCHNNATAK